MMDRRLNIQQAADVCGVTRRTIYNWIAAGTVQYVRTAGGSIRILESSLWRPGTQEVPHDPGPVSVRP